MCRAVEEGTACWTGTQAPRVRTQSIDTGAYQKEHGAWLALTHSWGVVLRFASPPKLPGPICVDKPNHGFIGPKSRGQVLAIEVTYYDKQ